MAIISTIRLPARWVSNRLFENCLRRARAPHDDEVTDVVFRVPEGCGVMVDAAVRLLSLANQLAPKKVILEFEGGEDGAFGYLNRIGFFDHLDDRVEVLPYRPLMSSAITFRGNNARLVEIAGISPSLRDQELPSRLSDALEEAVQNRRDRKSLGLAAFTVFSELIDNIFQHSATELGGFAVLQVYKNGVRVAVSDSGRGILQTLRPSLEPEFPRFASMSDTELVVEAFRTGLSRHGRDRGCGLKRSAEQAIKYNAILDVRLPTCLVQLVPSHDGYAPSMAYCYDNIPLIHGTHVCFDFRLDTQS